MARRDDREYRDYLSEEQRSQRGCLARRMQPDFHHGLLERTEIAEGTDSHGETEKRSDQLGTVCSLRNLRELPSPASNDHVIHGRKQAGVQLVGVIVDGRRNPSEIACGF